MFMSKLLKYLLAFALPMYIIDGDGGGHSESLTTDNLAEMLGGSDDNGQTEQSDPQNDEAEQENSEEAAQQDEAEGEQESAEEETEGQDEQPEKDSTEAFLELEINGEKVAVSKDEAKNGYLRQQDYTQKTQALANERQAAQQHIMQQFAEVQQMSQEIGQLTNIDAQLQEYQKVDWQTLRDTDPVSYGVHMAEYHDLRVKRGDVVTAIGQKQQQFGAMQAQEFAQRTEQAREHLAKVIPNFSAQHLGEMKEYGTKVGFKPEELATVTDGRMMQVLWEAAQYRSMQAKTKQAVKTVAALPTKAAKAAPASKPAAQRNLETQTRRLEQTGSVKDFAALLGMASKKG
jgi:chemotaxis protein histidine kinase CheA